MSTPVSAPRRRSDERRAARLAAEAAEAARASRRRRLVLLAGAVVLAAAVVAVAAVISSSGARSDTAAGTRAAGGPEAAARFAGIPERAGVIGDPGAPLKLVEYLDLQCPACKVASAATLPTIVRDYVRTGKATLEVRTLHFLGPDSERAARFAAGAERQGKLFPFLSVFYANQGAENAGYVTDGFLRSVARAAGVDADRAFAEAGSSRATGRLDRANADAARAGVSGTPTLTVQRDGGREQVLPDSIDPAAVSQALDAELAR